MMESPHIASASVERLKYMANSNTAQIMMRMGRGMFLLVFVFAMNPPPMFIS
jgi:hypothetical protein